MPSHALKVEVPADGSVPPPSMPRVPRRVLHFSDGTLEEYSTDEEDGVEPKVVQQSVTQLSSIDPKTLAWLPWFWYQTATAGSKTLEVCDYLGESLASFFGITTPKYQFEIDHYQQMLAEEEELKKQQDLEMGGWVAKSSENGGGEKNSDSITKAPSLQRFVIYKLPRLKHHANHLVRQGKAYAFITSESNNGWTPSDMGITDENSIPGLTLAPIYEDGAQENLLYILYNDQIPQHSKSRLSGGHSKGAVVGDHSGGFWLVHSVPHYPNDPRTSEDHSYPHTGLRNGQSFLCITMKPRQLKKTGQALWYNEVHAFATNIPVDLHGMYSKLAAVAYGESVDSPPWNSSYPIISAGGTTFRVFAKSQHYHKELYSYWVAPALRVSISVQTWPNGQSHQQSSCNGRYKVENIEETKVAGVRFSTKNDHSKWVVSESKRHPWVCVGDINKDDSQEKRGGGTVCVKDKFLWKAYHRSVVDVERCH